MTSSFQANPFKVQSPEKLPAKDAVSLFVNVFTDFHKIRGPGHSFLNGPRGCGKSMMFRFLCPDCQCLSSGRKLHELDFFSIWVPVKNTSLDLSELGRLEDHHGAAYVNEHLMTLFFAVEAMLAVTKSLALADPDKLSDPINSIRFIEGFNRLFAFAGVEAPLASQAASDDGPHRWIDSARQVCDTLYGQALQYIRHLVSREVARYDGPLLGYMDFLFPLLQQIRALTFLPEGPIYLLIDDADNLSSTQTRVLNSWVSSRTSSEVSIKVSTQMEYKTFRSISGRSIDSTHDFSEVNVADVYTSHKGKYLDRVVEIVEKRLGAYQVRDEAGMTPTPYQFFPTYEKQEQEIEAIKNQLRAQFEQEGRGYRAGDDVVRYARPIYMAQLAGSKKASSKYVYAGFEQLVHISSGIVRHFLEPAAHMFSELQSREPEASISAIPPMIQDEVIRAESNGFRFSELDKLRDDQSMRPEELETVDKLGNLIEVLGGVFRECLLNEGRAERRVFSIALYDRPDDELREVLRLGVRYGYLHRSSIGKKDGTGRTRLYILSRRLAPAFNLDPNGFVGYLWMSAGTLKEAIYRPSALLNRVRKNAAEELKDVQQLTLFD